MLSATIFAIINMIIMAAASGLAYNAGVEDQTLWAIVYVAISVGAFADTVKCLYIINEHTNNTFKD